MNKRILFVNIVLTAFAILIMSTQIAFAQDSISEVSPGGVSADNAPKSVKIDIYDTRNNAKYSYDLTNDAQLSDKLNNLISGILESGISNPGFAGDTTQNQIVNNFSATVASLYRQPQANVTGFWETTRNVVETGVKIGQSIGPLISLFGPGDYG